MTTTHSDRELQSYINRLAPKDQKLIRSLRSALRKRFPTANELAYDYTRFFVISYAPSERGIESIVTLAARPDGTRLYFMHGPQLPDPRNLLLGSGKQARYIRVEAASQLAHPDVEALIVAAVDRANVPLPSNGKGKLIIKTDPAKQRPRGKPKK